MQGSPQLHLPQRRCLHPCPYPGLQCLQEEGGGGTRGFPGLRAPARDPDLQQWGPLTLHKSNPKLLTHCFPSLSPDNTTSTRSPSWMSAAERTSCRRLADVGSCLKSRILS